MLASATLLLSAQIILGVSITTYMHSYNKLLIGRSFRFGETTTALSHRMSYLLTEEAVLWKVAANRQRFGISVRHPKRLGKCRIERFVHSREIALQSRVNVYKLSSGEVFNPWKAGVGHLGTVVHLFPSKCRADSAQGLPRRVGSLRPGHLLNEHHFHLKNDSKMLMAAISHIYPVEHKKGGILAVLVDCRGKPVRNPYETVCCWTHNVQG